MSKKKYEQTGEGYFKNIGSQDIGGKAEIIGYDDCCPPIFIGELLMRGGKNKLNTKIKKLEKYIANGGGYLSKEIIKDAHIIHAYLSKK